MRSEESGILILILILILIIISSNFKKSCATHVLYLRPSQPAPTSANQRQRTQKGIVLSLSLSLSLTSNCIAMIKGNACARNFFIFFHYQNIKCIDRFWQSVSEKKARVCSPYKVHTMYYINCLSFYKFQNFVFLYSLFFYLFFLNFVLFQQADPVVGFLYFVSCFMVSWFHGFTTFLTHMAETGNSTAIIFIFIFIFKRQRQLPKGILGIWDTRYRNVIPSEHV